MNAEEIEKLIEPFLPEEEGPVKTIAGAMNYSIRVGGKRLRPRMVYEAYRCFGGEDMGVIAPIMAAVEMIHNYSLCHDDLPAMDNDDYRRGGLTTHRKYGEAMGILAGDGLQTHAFYTAAKACEAGAAPETVVRTISILAEKSGIGGMLGGQAVDVESAEKNIDLYTITFIHKGKTAALIEASLMMGAVMANASEENIRLMEQLGEAVGIAFQIQDDILDVTGNFDELGKPIGSDDKNNKTTYVSLVGLDASKSALTELFMKARAIISELGERADGLSDILESLVGRKK